MHLSRLATAARRMRAPALVGVTLALAVGGDPVFAQGTAISRVAVDSQTITVTVPIEVVGVVPAALARWRDGIARIWNAGNDGRAFRICGRDVVFDPQFAMKASEHELSRRAHVVIVDEVRPGESYISRVWHALGTSPTYSVRTGFWGSTIDEATAAHEFGHLLGLLDEYVESENGLREPGERPVPDVKRYPDAWLSVMAHERGSVLERHIRDVLRIHGAAHTLSCR